MSRTLPDLIDALVAGAKGNWPSLTVCDGLPMELNSGDYLAIGIDDWDGRNLKATSGSSSEDWAGAEMSSGIDETGSITCLAWSHNGDADPKAARDAVYQIHSNLRSWLVATLRGTVTAFGVHGLWDVRLGGVDELIQGQGPDGAAAVIRFQITYQARIEDS